MSAFEEGRIQELEDIQQSRSLTDTEMLELDELVERVYQPRGFQEMP